MLTWLGRVARWVLIVAVLSISSGLMGRSTYAPAELVDRAIAQNFREWAFDLIGWEVDAISDKVSAFIEQPSADLSQDDATELVRNYLERARQIAALEVELSRLGSATAESELKTSQDDTQDASLGTSSEGKEGAATEEAATGDAAASQNRMLEIQAEIDELRDLQVETRLAAEAIIQGQVGDALVNKGLRIANQPFPPVLFSFTEPPKKLVVSPRNRIETRYAQMLDADITLDVIEESEQRIFEEQNLSAYVTNIGGLGAFPAMVVDRASLGWVLSTVAHEWVHNYLVLFPLGFNYGQNQEITIINETVADIIGNEIGLDVARRFYPEAVPPTPVPQDTSAQESSSSANAADINDDMVSDNQPQEEPPPFDFRNEMRETRLEVDRLLADGQVDAAEAYMEQQRLRFVEEGYNLRVLNQAYFAFHGNYGTSAAATSTIGPKLEELRELSPDLKSFVEQIRWLKTEAEIDNAINKIKE
ncbi:MAG: hypothetical protein AAF702_07325 [Chloroflexota bacterium]